MKYVFLTDFDFNIIIGKMLISLCVATALCDLIRLHNIFQFLISFVFFKCLDCVIITNSHIAGIDLVVDYLNTLFKILRCHNC